MALFLLPTSAFRMQSSSHGVTAMPPFSASWRSFMILALVIDRATQANNGSNSAFENVPDSESERISGVPSAQRCICVCVCLGRSGTQYHSQQCLQQRSVPYTMPSAPSVGPHEAPAAQRCQRIRVTHS
ncbi:hypothetical protein Vretimale_17927 [Volvox reticuliferus]|uniref:Uncharacterized protein n=1 Tax=Volvox reticuliferus TaxID=1737510 RepID=A0A8J4CVX8_9CHLO|nr:hypothetical protein Vretifemale_17685 [Volvox reticuliferus]GIM15115.1 hypothetical protein Vretimale_17927 [Volvox reticuliferus]